MKKEDLLKKFAEVCQQQMGRTPTKDELIEAAEFIDFAGEDSDVGFEYRETAPGSGKKELFFSL
jgi:hypothetical protein